MITPAETTDSNGWATSKIDLSINNETRPITVEPNAAPKNIIIITIPTLAVFPRRPLWGFEKKKYIKAEKVPNTNTIHFDVS